MTVQPVPGYIEPTTGMEFIKVRGGTFTMGYPKNNDHESERPAHKVRVNDMMVGMYEVTFDQYDKYCEATNREKPSDNEWGRGRRPVIHVSWDDAMDFASWLSNQTGLEFTLPSEAQFEYFSQTGMNPQVFVAKAPGKNIANCEFCGSPWNKVGTAPVGTFPPNKKGLYDTAGNVSEWCLDHYQGDYNGAPADDQPWYSEEGRERIHRGGHWKSWPEDLLSFARDWAPQNQREDYIGFRLILSSPISTK
jgi:formylglycine-generating enzyme required for sulfatase activity